MGVIIPREHTAAIFKIKKNINMAEDSAICQIRLEGETE